MRRFLLLFLLSIFESLSFPAKNQSFEVSRIDISDPDDRGVLPNIDTYFCINSELRSVVATALSNFSDSGTSAVDQLQAAIEVCQQVRSVEKLAGNSKFRLELGFRR
ncbi:unnamed protein product [Caenorhabditis brenneri]